MHKLITVTLLILCVSPGSQAVLESFVGSENLAPLPPNVRPRVSYSSTHAVVCSSLRCRSYSYEDIKQVYGQLFQPYDRQTPCRPVPDVSNVLNASGDRGRQKREVSACGGVAVMDEDSCCPTRLTTMWFQGSVNYRNNVYNQPCTILLLPNLDPNLDSNRVPNLVQSTVVGQCLISNKTCDTINGYCKVSSRKRIVYLLASCANTANFVQLSPFSFDSHCVCTNQG